MYWEVRSSGAERSDRDLLSLTKDTLKWLVREEWAKMFELTASGWRELELADPHFARLFEAVASWEPAENRDLNRVALTQAGARALESGAWASEFDPNELLTCFASAQTDSERWAYAGALAATADETLADRLIEVAIDPRSGRAGGLLLITAARAAGPRVRTSIERAVSEPRLRFLAQRALKELDESAH
jgi:hypothetical protein